MNLFSFRNSILALSILMPQLILAQVKIAQSGDWILFESKVGSSTICTLQLTDKKVLRAPDFIIEISKQKNSVSTPVEINMRILNNKRGNTSLIAKIQSTNSVISFLDINGNKDTFWGFAKNLSALIHQLAVRNIDLEMTAKGGEKTFDFSIESKGFKEMHNSMISNCNFNRPLVSPQFETELFKEVGGDLTLAGIPTSKVNFYRTAYFSAYAVFSTLDKTQNDLASVLAKYKVFQDELSNNKFENADIKSVQKPKAQLTLISSQQNQINQNKNISGLKISIPQLKKQLDDSTNEYNLTKKVIAPLEPRFNQLNLQLDQSRNQLNGANQRLASVENDLENLRIRISKLEDDASKLENELPFDRNQLEQARRDHIIAEQERSRYNAAAEVKMNLETNERYKGLQSEFESTRFLLDNKKTELNQNQLNLQEAEKGYNDTCKVEVVDPEIDCAKLLEVVNTIKQEGQNHQSSIDNYDSQLNAMRNKMQEIAQQTENQVQIIYRQLLNREAEASSRISRLSSSISSKQNSLSRIRNFDMPNDMDKQDQLFDELSKLERDIPIFKSNIIQIEQSLAQFKEANGWDAKLSNLNLKVQKLNADQANYTSSVNALANSEKALIEAVQLEQQMKKLLVDLDMKLVNLEKRAVELQQIISKLPAERSPIDKDIEKIKIEFAKKISAFTS